MRTFLLCCSFVLALASALPAQPPGATCKHLVLRQVGSYCNSDFEVDADSCCVRVPYQPTIDFGNLLLPFAPMVEHLTIENPSKSIFYLEFDKMKNLKSITLFGNDSDFVSDIPNSFFNLPTSVSISTFNIGLSNELDQQLHRHFTNFQHD